MIVKILNLEIKNFKGIKYLELNLDGKNAIIKGQNETGKTSIADAWYWLISGSNIDNQTKFDILSNDKDGNVINHQSAIVSAELLIDQTKIKLSKVYRQIWTRPRGQAEKILTAHTTDYFIDGNDVTATAYSNKINSLIDDNAFRILSDVRYFNNSLKMDERRAILLSICGEILPETILLENPDLVGLDSIMTEEDIKSNKSRIKKLKTATLKKIDSIPQIINELNKKLVKTTDITEEQLNELISEKINELGKLVSGNGIAEIEKQIMDLEKEEKQLEIDTKHKNFEKVSKKNEERSAIEDEKRHSEMMVRSYKSEVAMLEIKIDQLNDDRKNIIHKWKMINSAKLIDENICSECGQELPDYMINDRVENFNLDKAEQLKSINNKGLQVTVSIKETKKRIKELEDEIENYSKKIIDYDSQIKQIEKEIHAINNENNVDYSKKQVEISKKISELNKKILSLKDSIEPDRDKLKIEIEKLEREKSVIISQKEKKELIIELQSELQEHSKEYQLLEKELFLLEKYEIKRYEYIEKNISDKFSITKWRLFEKQMNGGVKNVCEAVYNGNAYSTNLNNGARIQIGMDCINTISDHYNVSVPVFIDNSESLTSDIDFEHQHIMLVVERGVEKLEVSIED